MFTERKTQTVALVLALAALPTLRSGAEQNFQEQENTPATAPGGARKMAPTWSDNGDSPLARLLPPADGSSHFAPVEVSHAVAEVRYHHDSAQMADIATKNRDDTQRYLDNERVSAAQVPAIVASEPYSGSERDCGDAANGARVTSLLQAGADFIAQGSGGLPNKFAPEFPQSPSHPVLALGERSPTVIAEMDADVKANMDAALAVPRAGQEVVAVAAGAVATYFGGPEAGAAAMAAVRAMPNPAELGVPGALKEGDSSKTADAVQKIGEYATAKKKEREEAEAKKKEEALFPNGKPEVKGGDPLPPEEPPAVVELGQSESKKA